jgi:hypothetical protein
MVGRKIFEKIWAAALIAWTVALLIGSLQPKRPAAFHVPLIHEILHVTSFLILASLASATFRNPRYVMRILVASFSFGLLIELLQHLFYGHPVEWWDVFNDSIGILLAIGLRKILKYWAVSPGQTVSERDVFRDGAIEYERR